MGSVVPILLAWIGNDRVSPLAAVDPGASRAVAELQPNRRLNGAPTRGSFGNRRRLEFEGGLDWLEGILSRPACLVPLGDDGVGFGLHGRRRMRDQA